MLIEIVDDVLKPWMHTVKMNLIHMRLMLGSFTDSQWKSVYKQAYEFVSPPNPILSPGFSF